MTNVTINRKRQTLTDRMVKGSTLAQRRSAFMEGFTLGASATRQDRAILADIRGAYGFAATATALLSPPSGNAKLTKGKVPSYGLTLQSHATKFRNGERVNACPWAGQCVKVCVLNRGHGRWDATQSARDYRTEFFATQTLSALRIMGAELARGIRKWGAILFRPNVNSDVDWAAVLGDLLQNIDGLTSYGYSKNPAILDGHDDGLNVTAYSYGETSDATKVASFVANGGRSAVVTNRKPGAPIAQWHPTAKVVDADVTDEWMFEPGVIGDLSFKTDDRNQNLKFVQNVY